ncbi:MAG TPA: branched-chain amino acid ABC transporter permease [Acidimicrobiales bacterium]|nr:branched-chain amino acid ABC transporter permease [Acidimicrobiales bacterium]
MLQVVLTGLSVGAVYGLVGMGFAVAFYVTRVLNFATGQLLMVAIMLTAALSAAHWPIALAMGVGLAASTLGGVLIYLLAVRPVLRFDRLSFAWLVSTLGVAIILESVAALIWGTSSLSFPQLLNGNDVNILGGALTWQQIATVLVALGAVVAFEAVRRITLFGKLGTAISADPEMSSAIGANVTLHAAIAFALGGLLAGIGGVLVGPISFANPYLGETYGIYGFIALMIGGTERPAASMGGGLILGILATLANTYINPQASDWFPFVVVLAVLLLTPKGIFASGDAIRDRLIGLARRQPLTTSKATPS